MKSFVNRTSELEKLNSSNAKLIVLFGRRRVGKTTLIERWSGNKDYCYTQSIEGSEGQQLEQIASDLNAVLPPGIVPRTWNELFGRVKTARKTHFYRTGRVSLPGSKPTIPAIPPSKMGGPRPARSRPNGHFGIIPGDDARTVSRIEFAAI
jgi:AAA+ ATPase superfamily predicted ATPase